MAEIESYRQFVNGEFVASEGNERVEVEFPYDGEPWATVPLGTPRDVDRAVAAARDAFEHADWAGLQPSERAGLIREVAAVIDEHADELAELETRQNGKLIREMSGQMNSLGDWFRYYASQCETREGDTIPVESKDGEMFNYVVREPYGVVGAVTPWNSPLLLTTFKLAPALAHEGDDDDIAGFHGIEANIDSDDSLYVYYGDVDITDLLDGHALSQCEIAAINRRNERIDAQNGGYDD